MTLRPCFQPASLNTPHRSPTNLVRGTEKEFQNCMPQLFPPENRKKCYVLVAVFYGWNLLFFCVYFVKFCCFVVVVVAVFFLFFLFVCVCVCVCVCVWIYILYKFMEMVLQSIIFSWGSESAGTAPSHLTVWRSAGIFWSGSWWPGPSKGRTVSYSVGYDLGYIHSPQHVLIWCAVKHMLVSYT